jgi:outer membrane protein TolC
MISDSSTHAPVLFDARSCGLSMVALVASGCVGARAQVDAEKTIAESLALAGAVVFHEDGGPIDAPAGPADALPLHAAVRRAVETSPELQAALARVRVAEAESDLARLLPNPILAFAVRIPEGGGRPDLEGSLSQDLLAILERPRRSSAAAHRLEAEAATALSTALDVVAEVQDLYASVQVLEELVPLLEDRLSVLDRLRAVAQARLELGEGTRHDVTTLDSERLELAVEASRTRQELRLARVALTHRIGEPSGAATWQLDRWDGPPTVPTTESAWIETGLRARPEVLAIEWELRARGDEAALARWGAWDGLAVGLDEERTGNESSLGPAVAVPVRIFDRGSERERRAHALQAEARHRLIEAQRAVVEEVRSSLATLRGSQENLERVVGELIPLQERRRSEVEEAFRLGHVDVTALLFAEQALQQTQTLRVGLEREVSTALLRLERSVGGRSAFDSGICGRDSIHQHRGAPLDRFGSHTDRPDKETP